MARSLRRKWMWFFAAALILAACTPASAGPRPVGTSAPATTARLATATASSSAASITPPPASLTIAGQTQSAALGSYCWIGAGGQQSCSSLAGMPTAHEPLFTATTPFSGQFHLPLADPPDSVTLSMRAVTPFDDLSGGSGEFRLWRSTSGWAGEMPLKADFENQFMDGPGLYVLALDVRWKDHGSVTYGFLVQVGPTVSGSNLPTSSVETPYPIATPMSLQVISPQVRMGHGGVQALLVSPDGGTLAVATPAGVYGYDLRTEKQLWFRSFENRPMTLAFSPDGSRLAVGLTGSRMPIVEVRSGQTVLELQGEESLRGTWSPDGKLILTSGECEQILLWEAASGKIVRELQPARCNGVTPGLVVAAWSGDGKVIYSCEDPNGVVLAWDAQTFQPLAGYSPHPPEYTWSGVPVPSPRAELFALNNGNTVSIMDGKTGEPVKVLAADGTAMGLYDIHWSPDGKLLLAENYLWEASSGRFLQKFEEFTKLAWLPDGNSLIGLNYNVGSLQAFSISSGKTQFSLPDFAAISSAPAPFWQGNNLLTYYGQTVTRWDISTGQPLERTPVTREPAGIQPAEVSPDGKKKIDFSGEIVDTATGQELTHIDDTPSHGRDFNAWSPDGSQIVSGDSIGVDSTVLWDAGTGKILRTLSLDAPGNPYLGALAWSPDGMWIAAAGSQMDGAGYDNGMIALWDAASGKQVQLLTQAMSSERIMAAAWSHDGRWLAAGMYSGRIVLWDMKKFIPVASLDGHVDTINSLRWSPDDKLLASSSSDGTVIVWKTP